MVFHVGIDPREGNASYYNDIKKRITNLKIIKVDNNEIDKVNQMFKVIISKITGSLGCVCIYLPLYYGNKIRKKFIEEGLKFGFKNVEFSHRGLALYLNAMSQISYKPFTGDIIWIISDVSLFIWKIEDKKAKLVYYDAVSFSSLSDIKKALNKSKLKKGPDLALGNFRWPHDDEGWEAKINKLSVCKTLRYDVSNFACYGSLIRAQITAGNNEYFHLDTAHVLSAETVVYWTKKETPDLWKPVIEFPDYHPLPINHLHVFKNNPNYDTLIVTDRNDTITMEFPNCEKLDLQFTMDINEIFTVTVTEHIFTSEEEHSSSNTIAKKLKSFFFQTPTIDANNYIIPKKLAHLNTSLNAIGIDLGTSRCCAAVNRKNGISTVHLDNMGQRLLPSYVAYDEQNVKCGQVVVNRLRQFSKSTIFDSKRIIGRTFNDIEIDSNWNFSVNNKNEKIFLEVNGFNGKKKVLPEEVAAELLKFMKQKTEEYQGLQLSQAIITVPAAFSESQKAATKTAAELAGWKTTHLLPEPIAAAFAYFVDRPIPNNSNVLLFDLGGGTLDVCIFKIENNKIKIISNTGDTKLGGRDFDTILINYFKNILLTKYGISSLRDKKYKLMLECQRIKEDLSTAMTSSLQVDEMDSNQDGIISISRDEFQSMTQTLLNKIKNTIHAALNHSKYDANQINKVLQVGGGSRMPMIKQLLQEIFPKADHICEEHPDEVVAIGAAYYAYNIFSK